MDELEYFFLPLINAENSKQVQSLVWHLERMLIKHLLHSISIRSISLLTKVTIEVLKKLKSCPVIVMGKNSIILSKGDFFGCVTFLL